jgi:hypothetical protein
MQQERISYISYFTYVSIDSYRKKEIWLLPQRLHRRGYQIKKQDQLGLN